jgi:hypothetical protein
MGPCALGCLVNAEVADAWLLLSLSLAISTDPTAAVTAQLVDRRSAAAPTYIGFVHMQGPCGGRPYDS